MASVDILAPPPRYSLYSSSGSVSTSSLPSFTSELRPDEESLQFQLEENSAPTQHDYVYSSRSMVLNLGRKIHGASHPTYGANSEIRGTVALKDLKGVKQVTLKISGKVSYFVLEDGFSAYTQCRTVLQHSQTLFSSNSQSSPANSTFPLSFHIPTYAHQSNSHLPPSIHNSKSSDPLTRLSIHLDVRYRIDVEVRRYGLHRRERVGTEWWHAPRTFALPSRPRRSVAPELAAWESGVKTPPSRSDEVEWRTFRTVATGASPSDIAVEISLPRRFTYALGGSVPFQIRFLQPIFSILPKPSDMNSRLSLHLVKQVTFQLGYTTSEVSKPTVTGAKITDVLFAEDGACIASGSIQLPSSEEPSWHIAPFVETSFSLHLAFVHSSTNKTYQAEVPLKLTSDEESALQMEGEEAWARPARSTIEALEVSSHLEGRRLLLPATFAGFFKSIL